MHPAPQAIYSNDVDFAALARQDPDFNRCLKPNAQLDFSSSVAVRQLTTSLLKRDFGLEIELPEDRLCPPVPNRFNYILWVQDLLDTTTSDDDYYRASGYDEEREVVGLDIGTGSSCIYPLLGCAQRPKWRFIATDIDEKNISYARRNILLNDLKSFIRPLHRKPQDALIPLDELGIKKISFTLTNPPFHPSPASLLASAALKSRPPHSACTGALVEMVTPGGETAFAARLIAESAVLRGRVRWFTTLLGKYSSVGVVVEELKRNGVRNWDVRAFVQGAGGSGGGRTRRWGVGWSWGGRRPVLGDDRGVPRGLLPFPGRFAVLVPGASVQGVAGKLEQVFGGMDLRWGFRPEVSAGVGSARANVWSRAARRQQQQQQQQRVRGGEGGGGQNLRNDEDMKDDDGEDDEEEEEPALGFKVQLRVPDEGDGTEVVVSWVRGSESVLFESFCGMLKRRLIVVG